MDAANREPMPEKNDGEYIVDLVKKDLERRAEVGEKKYGTKLQAFNGRDALIDAYQEALDLCVYLRQCIEESEKQRFNEAIQIYNTGMHEHVCGLTGYNPMLGDICPGCEKERNGKSTQS